MVGMSRGRGVGRETNRETEESEEKQSGQDGV